MQAISRARSKAPDASVFAGSCWFGGRGADSSARECCVYLGGSRFGSANGNRTRISALKGPRANRCTIAPQGTRDRRDFIIGESRGIDKAPRKGPPSSCERSSAECAPDDALRGCSRECFRRLHRRGAGTHPHGGPRGSGWLDLFPCIKPGQFDAAADRAFRTWEVNPSPICPRVS